MYIVFADDAKQNHPSRQRMGPLVAAGAILVHMDRLQHLETSIEALCQKRGFPVDDPLKSEFKWSPGRELWMWSNLTVTDRERFFLSVIDQLREAEVKVIVAIDDKNCPVAKSSEDRSRQLTHEQDATYLLFEKINWLLRDLHENAIVINDRPSQRENDFLAAGLEMWRKGTRFVQFDQIAINLLCTQSRFVRLCDCLRQRRARLVSTGIRSNQAFVVLERGKDRRVWLEIPLHPASRSLSLAVGRLHILRARDHL
jgi:hypothetical protein